MTPTLPFLEVEETAPQTSVRVEAPLDKEVLAYDLMQAMDRLHSMIDRAAIAGPTAEMEQSYMGIRSWLRMNRRAIRRLLALTERQQDRLSTWNPNSANWDELQRVMKCTKLSAAALDPAHEMRRLADACRAQARRARSALAR